MQVSARRIQRWFVRCLERRRLRESMERASKRRKEEEKRREAEIKRKQKLAAEVIAFFESLQGVHGRNSCLCSPFGLRGPPDNPDAHLEAARGPFPIDRANSR